jgi:hypothetical protein
MNGFFEFGLPALIAFIFTTVMGGKMLIDQVPPSGAYELNTEWKRLEEGVAVEGAKLVTPKISEKVPVA